MTIRFVVVLVVSIGCSNIEHASARMFPTTATNVTASVGDSVRFACVTNTSNEIRWRYTNLTSGSATILYNGVKKNANWPMQEFSLTVDDQKGLSELGIKEVGATHAGQYACLELSSPDYDNIIFQLSIHEKTIPAGYFMIGVIASLLVAVAVTVAAVIIYCIRKCPTCKNPHQPTQHPQGPTTFSSRLYMESSEHQQDTEHHSACVVDEAPAYIDLTSTFEVDPQTAGGAPCPGSSYDQLYEDLDLPEGKQDPPVSIYAYIDSSTVMAKVPQHKRPDKPAGTTTAASCSWTNNEYLEPVIRDSLRCITAGPTGDSKFSDNGP